MSFFPTCFRWHGNVGQFGRYRIQLFDVDTGRPECSRNRFASSQTERVLDGKCTFQCHRSPSSNIIVCCNRLLTQFRIQKEQRINYVKENDETRNEAMHRLFAVRPATRKSIQFHRNHRAINQKSISSKAFRTVDLSVAHLLESPYPSIDQKKNTAAEVAKEWNGMEEWEKQIKKKERNVCRLFVKRFA